MRIKRVVEIEHPGVDVGEGAGGRFHLNLSAVMPAQAGIQYAAAVVIVIDVTAYWITRFRG
jgi:hypothetical protein